VELSLSDDSSCKATSVFKLNISISILLASCPPGHLITKDICKPYATTFYTIQTPVVVSVATPVSFLISLSEPHVYHKKTAQMKHDPGVRIIIRRSLDHRAAKATAAAQQWKESSILKLYFYIGEKTMR
jgi:hypothetical protein